MVPWFVRDSRFRRGSSLLKSSKPQDTRTPYRAGIPVGAGRSLSWARQPVQSIEGKLLDKRLSSSGRREISPVRSPLSSGKMGRRIAGNSFVYSLFQRVLITDCDRASAKTTKQPDAPTRRIAK